MAIADTEAMVLTGVPAGVEAAIARERMRLEKLAEELLGAANVVEAPRHREVHVVIVD